MTLTSQVKSLLLIGLLGVSRAQSGNEFVDAIVSHLRVSPFLVDTLNRTSYKGDFQVQDNVRLSNVSSVFPSSLHQKFLLEPRLPWRVSAYGSRSYVELEQSSISNSRSPPRTY